MGRKINLRDYVDAELADMRRKRREREEKVSAWQALREEHPHSEFNDPFWGDESDPKYNGVSIFRQPFPPHRKSA